MKRVALRGSWETPPTPFQRNWETDDANVFIQRLSLDIPTSPKRIPLGLQTTFGDWPVGSKPTPTKEISPTHVKAVHSKPAASLLLAKKAEFPVRRKVGLAVCGDGDEHQDPAKQASECASRITSIVRALEQRKELSNLIINLNQASRTATDSELLTVHTKGYIKKLERLTKCDDFTGTHTKDHDRQINAKAVEEFDSVFMTAKTVEAARLSAGLAILSVEAVCTGQVQVAAAAIRPPGHHAESHCAMGFCFFNNAALAAKRALEFGIKRILIVDQDIHHGNGTQRTFWDDERVLYFSIHRWDKGRFYPHNEVESAPSCTGPKDSAAAGKTMNVAFCDGEMGDLEYRAVWESVLLPVAKEFRPELIIFSAGFDAAEGDPIGRYHVSPGCFGAMVSSVTSSCPSAKVVLLLEGGYNTTATAQSFCECVRALTFPGDIPHCEWPNVSKWSKVKDQALDAINTTIKFQAPYWTCLAPVKHSPHDEGRTVTYAA